MKGKLRKSYENLSFIHAMKDRFLKLSQILSFTRDYSIDLTPITIKELNESAITYYKAIRIAQDSSRGKAKARPHKSLATEAD